MNISVIIPTHNRATTISRAIDSVLSQDGIDSLDSLQLIVVDDGSSDGTDRHIRKHYPECLFISSAKNKGVSAARNLGLKQARGEWIALLDSDDEWLPHKLNEQVKLLTQTGLLFCHTEEIWVRNGVRVNQMKKHRKVGGWVFERCLPLCAISPSSVLMHRSILDNVGLFDEDLPVCEDYDLWLRIAANYEVAFVEKPCITKFGGHEDQLSRQYWGMDRFRVMALEKILHSSLSTQNYQQAREMLLKKLQILLIGAKKHENKELQDSCEEKIQRWTSH